VSFCVFYRGGEGNGKAAEHCLKQHESDLR
jgi:hypothetical protein